MILLLRAMGVMAAAEQMVCAAGVATALGAGLTVMLKLRVDFPPRLSVLSILIVAVPLWPPCWVRARFTAVLVPVLLTITKLGLLLETVVETIEPFISGSATVTVRLVNVTLPVLWQRVSLGKVAGLNTGFALQLV